MENKTDNDGTSNGKMLNKTRNCILLRVIKLFLISLKSDLDIDLIVKRTNQFCWRISHFETGNVSWDQVIIKNFYLLSFYGRKMLVKVVSMCKVFTSIKKLVF